MTIEHLKNIPVRTSIYVNPEKKCIWIRIHRTGTTSLWEHFRERGFKNPADNLEKNEEFLNSLTDADILTWYSCTFVRDPYDRFVSIARHFGYTPEYLAMNYDYITGLRNVVLRHSFPQSRFTHFNGQRRVQFIGKFETYMRNFGTLCKLMNLDYEELPKLNSSKRGRTEDELTPDTINFINKYYDDDFRNFEYQKK